MLQRYWINQPSTIQPNHALHGQNVLCDMKQVFKGYVDVYFTQGPVISSRMAMLSLSKGWHNRPSGAQCASDGRICSKSFGVSLIKHRLQSVIKEPR